MSSSKKCCVFLNLDLGCALIAVFSLIVSSAISVSCIVILVVDNNEDSFNTKGTIHRLTKILNFEYAKTSMHIVIVMLAIVAILGVLASMALIQGLQKNKAGYVFCYFAYGIVLVFLVELSALLIILTNKWIPAICFFLAGLIYSHILVVIYNVYESMPGAKSLISNPYENLDDECLIVNDNEV